MIATEAFTAFPIFFGSPTTDAKQLTKLVLKVPDELNALGMLPESSLDDTSKMHMTGNILLLLGREPVQQQDNNFSSFGQPTRLTSCLTRIKDAFIIHMHTRKESFDQQHLA